jgi:hypothetical protein
MDTKSSLRNIVLKNTQDVVLDKDKTIDNVQKHNLSTMLHRHKLLDPIHNFTLYTDFNDTRNVILRRYSISCNTEPY